MQGAPSLELIVAQDNTKTTKKKSANVFGSHTKTVGLLGFIIIFLLFFVSFQFIPISELRRVHHARF